MDFARKLGKKRSDETWSNQKLKDRVPLDCCNKSRPNETLEEDRRLVNWKRWLADRQRRQCQLARALDCRPIDLALNAHEKVRARNETLTLLEAAVRTEVVNQDKYRGNPAFWRPPQRLTQTREECENLFVDDVIVRRGRGGDNLPPDMTRVALPAFIRNEKMLLESCLDTSRINLDSKWDRGDYLRQRTSEMRREMEFLEPKKPETEDLIIIGRNFECGDQKSFIRTPVITITPEESRVRLLNDPEERMALKVQDREFILENGYHFEKLSLEKSSELQKSGEDNDEKLYAYSVFESDRVYKILPKKVKSVTFNLNFYSHRTELNEQEFILENKGVRTLKVEWRDVTPKSSLPIPKRFDRHFFFNKNQISILPGQTAKIPIWFRSDKPTVATETWQLFVEPKVFPGNLMLRLWATSGGEKWESQAAESAEKIKYLLKQRVRTSVIREVIEYLLFASTCERAADTIPYHMFFLESEIFEARNPKYRFGFVELDELKRIYSSATGKNDWSLSLPELRQVLLNVEDPCVRCENLERFTEICFKLLRPLILSTRTIDDKKSLVHGLLGMFLNRFEDEHILVSENCRLYSIPEDLEEDQNPEIGGGETECSDIGVDPVVYQEVMYVRIYCLLCETIEGICATIDYYNYFNKDRFN